MLAKCQKPLGSPSPFGPPLAPTPTSLSKKNTHALFFTPRTVGSKAGEQRARLECFKVEGFKPHEFRVFRGCSRVKILMGLNMYVIFHIFPERFEAYCW